MGASDDSRMKVLYLTDPEPDYLADQIYEGLCTLLGWQQVFDFPGKATYHDPALPSYYLQPNPGHGLTRDRVIDLLGEHRIDLVIVSSPRRGAVETCCALTTAVALPPVILIDGEDDDDIRADMAARLRAALYFKREFKDAQKSAQGQWRWARKAQYGSRLDGRIFPLPFSVTAALLQSALLQRTAEQMKDIDISFVGRASHRKRVRAVNSLRRTQGIRFEGGIYLDASDRRSKLAESRLGVLAAKLVGDPRAPASAQESKLNVDDYRLLLRRSKMALSIRGGGFDTLRYWEIVATRTLLVSEPPDIVIPHNFEHGRHAIFCREDLRDLPAIVRRFRDDDETRGRMVEAAYQHLLAFHTSERRAAYLLEQCRAAL